MKIDDVDSIGNVPVVAPFRIGRREGFDLCLTSPNVSGLHAEILEEGGALWLHDLNSTNGTFVNDERIRAKAKLQDGDSIIFGNRQFRLIMDAGDRKPLATVPNAEPMPAAESAQQKFQRLLDSGAVPFFQPIHEISSFSQRLIGYEVLGRSRIFGLNTPEQMFAAAIPLEMESELSRVLRRRGIEAAQDKLPEDLTLFVNTHPAEVERSTLGESLQELRKSHSNRPIVLELSETSLKDPDSFSELRSLLQELNIGLALHDFSAGKIHLAELNEISPDIVKFDCALLQGVNKAPMKRQRLIRAMVKMVKELGITPMAEYIESNEEHESLIQLGFEYGQGYHYGRPIDVETVTTTVEKQQAKSASKKEVLASDSADIVTSESKRRPLDLIKDLKEKDTSVQTSQSEKTASDATKSQQPAGVYRDFDWLKQQNVDHYTIQLSVSVSKEAAENFIASQSLPGDYTIIQKRGKNKDLFVVLFGVFEDRAKAKLKVEGFKELRLFPLVRRLSAVQSEALKKVT